MSVPKHRVTAYIGPSGCGKSTLLRCINRMNDLVDGVRTLGNVRIGGTDIYDRTVDVTELRKRVGMVGSIGIGYSVCACNAAVECGGDDLLTDIDYQSGAGLAGS